MSILSISSNATTDSPVEILNKGKRLALVVGVNKAPSSILPSLNYAAADVEAMANVFQQNCHFDLLESPILNEKATSSAIKKAILDLARDRSDEDFLLIYFSGHGKQIKVEAERDEVYLVTYDFNEKIVEEDEDFHISLKWLREKLYERSKAGRVLVILDCCFAGEMGRTEPDHYLEELQTRLKYYFAAPGAASGSRSGGMRWALTATGHAAEELNARAAERDGHGLMTSLLLPALSGKVEDVLGNRGEVSIEKLYYYLFSQMERIKSKQRPSLSGDSAGRSCILAYYPEYRHKQIVSQQLTTGLTVLSIDYAARIQNFITEYLGTAERPVPFGGRETDVVYLNAWLDEPKAPPYLLLAAPAGRGKSALLVRWGKELLTRNDLAVVFFPVSIRFRTNLAGVVFATLTARLAFLHGEKVPAALDAPLEVWRGLITDYLTRSLPNGRRLLLILDGVDEASDWEAGPDLFPLAPPQGLRIVLSARYLVGDTDAKSWLRRVGWYQANLAQVLDLNPLTVEGVADVLQHMSFPLDRLGTRTDIVTELYRLSEGDPLLVRLYVDDLLDRGEIVARLRPEELSIIRPGMDGYFSRWWEDQRGLWGNQKPLREPAIQALLNLLACALGPLSQEDILQLAPPNTRLTNWTIEEDLRPLKRFVSGDGRRQGYVFNHPRLGTYFYEEHLSAHERRDVENQFLAWGRETCKQLNEGELPVEQSSAYIVQYYGAHLERAKNGPEALLTLVSKGWYQAWEMLEGTHTGFLNDAGRAWRAAENKDKEAIGVGQSAPYLEGEVRCALCRASINSLAKNIPTTLLVDVVEKGIWTSAQGLAYARHILDLGERAKALVRLTPYLPDPLRGEVIREALETARAIVSKGTRARVLTTIASYLSERLKDEIVTEALETVRLIDKNFERVRALASLAALLPEKLKADVFREVLEATQLLEHESEQVTVLSMLAPHVPQASTKEVLEAIQAIEYEHVRVMALVRLLPRLSEELRGEVVQEILKILRLVDQDTRTSLLMIIVPYLSEELKDEVVQEVLEAAQSMDEGDGALLLTLMIPHVPEVFKGEVVNDALEAIYLIKEKVEQALALAALVPHLPETLLQMTIETVQKQEQDTGRALILATLVPHLSKAFIDEGLQEALKAIWTIREKNTWARALALLAPYLSEELLQKALEGANVIGDNSDRVKVLGGLASSLEETLKDKIIQEALQVAHTIEKDVDRVEILTLCLPHVSESKKDVIVHEALEVIWLVKGKESRIQALTTLLPHVPESLKEEVMREALEMVRVIKERADRARTLAVLIPHLSEPLKEGVMREVLKAAWAIRERAEWEVETRYEKSRGRITAYERLRIEMLATLLPHMDEVLKGEMLQEALEEARTIREKESRIRALAVLLPHMDEVLKGEMLQEALNRAKTIKEEGARVRALAVLMPYLSESQKEEMTCKALEAARAIKNAEIRAHALAVLLPNVSELLKKEGMHEVLEATRTIKERAEWEAATRYEASRDRIIAYEKSWAEMLVTLLPHVSETQKEEMTREVLETAQTIKSRTERVRVLVVLLPYMSESLKGELFQEALRIARTIKEKAEQVRALAALLPYSSDSMKLQVMREALEAARAIRGKSEQARVLVQLTDHMIPITTNEVIRELLEVVQIIKENSARVEVVAQLVPQLPEALKHQVINETLGIARTIAYEGSRAHALALLIPHLSEPLKNEVIQEAFRAAQSIKEKEELVRVLTTLAKHLPKELRDDIIREALEDIRTIDFEINRARALVVLIPYISEALQEDILEIAQAIKDENARAQIVVALIPHVSKGALLQKILEIAYSFTKKYEQALVLTTLASHMSPSLKDEMIQKALEAALMIVYERLQAKVLIALAPHLHGQLKEETVQKILNMAKIIRNEDDQIEAIGYQRAGIQSLIILVPHLPNIMNDQVVLEALDAAYMVMEKGLRGRALSVLIPHLPEKLRMKVAREALEVADVITYEGTRAEVLIALIPHLSEPLRSETMREVLTTAQTMEDVVEKVQVLVKLIPHLSEPILYEALEEAKVIWKKFGHTQVKAYAEAQAQTTGYKEPWIQVLIELAPHLPEELLRETLRSVRAIPYSGIKAEGLAALAPHLPETLLLEALEEARTILHEMPRAKALVALAPYMSEALKHEVVLEALETTWAIANEKSKALALAALVPHLSEKLRDDVVQDALEAARSIEQEDEREFVEAVRTLFPDLPELLLLEWLETDEMRLYPTTYEGSKAETLTKLVPYLPEKLKGEVIGEALERALAIKKKKERTRVLVELIPHLRKLPPLALYPLWCETLHTLANHTRQDLLANLSVLIPIISILGSSDALVKTSQSILEIGNWWP